MMRTCAPIQASTSLLEMAYGKAHGMFAIVLGQVAMSLDRTTGDHCLRFLCMRRRQHHSRLRVAHGVNVHTACNNCCETVTHKCTLKTNVQAEVAGEPLTDGRSLQTSWPRKHT